MTLPELNYKKIFLIIGFVVIAGLLIYGVIRVFFISPSGPEVGPIAGIDPSELVTGQLPDVGERDLDEFFTDQGRFVDGPVDSTAQGSYTQVLPVNKNRILNPTATRDGLDVAYYDPSDNKFYRLSSDGINKTLLTDKEFYSVESVSWSPSKDKVVIEYPDGSNIIYDFITRQSVTLPQAVVDPVFTSNSDNLAFKTNSSNPGDNWLIISDSDGGNPKLVEPIGDRGDLVQVVWSPDEQVVGIYHQPISATQEEIFLLGQAGENFKSFIVDGLNFLGKFSPNGDRLLYHVVSGADNYIPSLWIVDVKGANLGLNKFNLGLNTWIEKCTFSSDERKLFCAVPSDLEAGAGLSSSAKFLTSDIFYKLDLTTGLKQLIALPVDNDRELNVAVSDIWLDSQENNLFFWDARSGGVYKIRLR